MTEKRKHITDNKLYREFIEEHCSDYSALMLTNIGDVYYDDKHKYIIKGYDRVWILIEKQTFNKETGKYENGYNLYTGQNYSRSEANKIAANCIAFKIKQLGF